MSQNRQYIHPFKIIKKIKYFKEELQGRKWLIFNGVIGNKFTYSFVNNIEQYLDNTQFYGFLVICDNKDAYQIEIEKWSDTIQKMI